MVYAPAGREASQDFQPRPAQASPDLDWDELRQSIISCTVCPRLVRYRQEVATRPRREFAGSSYWARPVPGFGDPRARVLVVGLAPAAHGANRTGRMFTGDGSGDFLVAALYRAGFASQPWSRSADDGLTLRDVFLTAPVRCAPPDNRPLPQERDACFPFLQAEYRLLAPRLRVILALGHFAYASCRRLVAPWLSPQQRQQLNRTPFRHGAVIELPKPLPYLVLCYHPSRQNTQTGRLTAAMMDAVLRQVRRILEDS